MSNKPPASCAHSPEGRSKRSPPGTGRTPSHHRTPHQSCGFWCGHHSGGCLRLGTANKHNPIFRGCSYVVDGHRAVRVGGVINPVLLSGEVGVFGVFAELLSTERGRAFPSKDASLLLRNQVVDAVCPSVRDTAASARRSLLGRCLLGRCLLGRCLLGRCLLGRCRCRSRLV